jgi:hypothetical protein
MSELATFQNEFARALTDPRSASARGLGPGLAVHQNTVLKAFIDALAANFPTVEELVGPEWFAACAAEYVRARPPRSAVLALYGKEFPTFLAQFAPARALAYLTEVARIDRLWTESHFARDARALPADALAGLSAVGLFELRVALHPATRFGWFQSSAVTIWRYHRSAHRSCELELEGQPEGAVLARPHGPVECIPLDKAGFAFLEQVRCGATLGAAATAALEVDRATDLAARLAQFVAAGLFSALNGDRP